MEKCEKILNTLAIIAIIIFFAFCIFMYFEITDMITDHECFVDGHYDTPKCQKYIGGN